MQENILIGIDLAGMEKKPTGWTLCKKKVITTCHLYENQETLCARKALKIPTKDWKKIQNIFLHMSFKGDPETRALTSHQIDAITAALTGYLYLKEKTELLGDEEEGYIVDTAKGDWRRLKL